ncbi:DUF551 domain-containing protein [Enterobacter hormaechei]|jgi:hypothetical protein|uniref:DUF551 domain-containing protein n=1 Tax=Enterobacter cloacae complex TaxID=354276 RepID=UPI0007933088|nr:MULTISPECIES: DUF551 domain-containing protein [Enterobacter cloacae complex]EMD6795862.1 DUF551 domain-containing protein [Enterobacter hormaechei subsp. steigerwaltii]EJR0237629.1 DUF551 domain-containing protein [Enterobacter hormaechei]EKT9343993.1 DUF551 domain-containing protein [Enterobacter hormaechei]EKT9370938.1 DUF551 domain-containing protein [Enterobacter hormaechei]EKU4024913.1 DUF551 domain-containing protein [Enterobacter hormaechei]
MITFTKEQLIASAHARIEFAEMMLAGELEPLKERTWSIELELARIALASLEAEPVAYMYKDNLHADARFSLHTRFGNWSQEDINEYEITEIPLYTAPPAPVSVPDAIHSQGEKSASDDYYALGWNACRAAMLQGADGNAPAHFRSRPAQSSLSPAQGGNSPVIPDGWVACSERMPEGMTDVHISNGHDVGQGWWDGETWQTQHDYYSVPGDVTHWMPLPAAPQQEVK